MDVTTKELCQWYGVTSQTISDWCNQGMPVERGGGRSANKYDSVLVHKWLLERDIAKRVTKDDDGEFYDRAKEEARLKYHQANMEELKEQEKRGELIPLDMAERIYSDYALNCKNKFLRVVDVVSDKQEKKKLKEAIYSALYELQETDFTAGADIKDSI